MPKLHVVPEQHPLQLYPIVGLMDAENGGMPYDYTNIATIDATKKITLAKLAFKLGEHIGPSESAINDDSLLDVTSQDIERAAPRVIEAGLYIPHTDPRWRNWSTEQLVTLTPRTRGVVFPSDQFKTVARSPADMAKHIMSTTRNASKDDSDPEATEAKIGRSAAHGLSSKIDSLTKLDAELQDERNNLIKPVYLEAIRNQNRNWSAHYKPKNLDKLRADFDDKLHDTINTAVINMDISVYATKALHRAVTSNLYRRGSSNDIANAWVQYSLLSGTYMLERRNKVAISIKKCATELKNFQPFLDQKTA